MKQKVFLAAWRQRMISWRTLPDVWMTTPLSMERRTEICNIVPTSGLLGKAVLHTRPRISALLICSNYMVAARGARSATTPHFIPLESASMLRHVSVAGRERMISVRREMREKEQWLCDVALIISKKITTKVFSWSRLQCLAESDSNCWPNAPWNRVHTCGADSFRAATPTK